MPCIRQFAQFNDQYLHQLDAQLVASIDQIRSHITEYIRAVSDWQIVINEHRLLEDDSAWAQTQLRHHAAFFTDLSRAPSREHQRRELMQTYQDARQHLQAYLAGRPASAPLADATSARTLTDRRGPAPLAGTESPARSDATFTVSRSGKQEISSPPANAVPLPPVSDIRHHFYAKATPSSDSRPPSGTRFADARPMQSPVRPSFRGGRTFADSFRRSGPARPTGIMTSADGNIATTIPLAWQPLQPSQTLHRPTTATDSASAPLADGTLGSGSNVATAGSSAPANRPARNISDVHRQRLRTVLQHAANPAPAPTAAPGSGSSVPTSGPLLFGADGLPFNASSSSGPLGSTASPADFGEDFSLENSSAFYRNATFHRAASSSAAPSPLVLKDLPITPFEGDIRQYAKFRDRFLDVVEAHPNLAARHKLQYLLQFLRGEPHRLANNLQITDTNYYAVVNLLEERYGNADVIRNLLMQNLIAIRPPTQSVADLRRFHDEAFRVATDLKQLGDDVDANRLYEQTLMAKLSSALKIELIRHSDYTQKKSISSILDGLRKYTAVLELSASSGVIWGKFYRTTWLLWPGRHEQVPFSEPPTIRQSRSESRLSSRQPTSTFGRIRSGRRRHPSR